MLERLSPEARAKHRTKLPPWKRRALRCALRLLTSAPKCKADYESIGTYLRHHQAGCRSRGSDGRDTYGDHEGGLSHRRDEDEAPFAVRGGDVLRSPSRAAILQRSC